jgi:hypothetical protein
MTQFLELEQPKPASADIPSWYKNMQSYVGGSKGTSDSGITNGTIKKCIPVFDAITAGYIIPLPVDVYVKYKDGVQTFEYPSFNMVTTHSMEQAPEHPFRNGVNFPKWMNPWSIKTAKGYSCLFVSPFHRDSLFTTLPGVVDTDTYIAQVNLPFVMNDSTFEGLIPKGTPMVQVIPFKRESWKMKLGNSNDKEEALQSSTRLFTKIFDKYKTMFWSRKEYT